MGWEVKRESGCGYHLGSPAGLDVPLPPSRWDGVGGRLLLGLQQRGLARPRTAASPHAEATIRRFNTFSPGLEAEAGGSV